MTTTTATADRDALIVQYVPLACHVAGKLMARPEVARMGYDEAVSVGLAALVNAAGLWDPARGVSFMTYAHTAISREVRRAARGHSLVRVPLYQTDPAHPAHRRRHSADVARAFATCGLPAAWGGDGPGHGPPEPAAQEPPCPLEAAEGRERVARALGKLPPAWRRVVRLRFGVGGGGPLLLHEVGRRVGLTKQRVSQVLALALERLRKLLVEVA